MASSTTTDWISAISAAIGIPGAIAAFILLFWKDKSKQDQLDRLSEIADSLKESHKYSEEMNRLMADQVATLQIMAAGSLEGENASKDLALIEEEKLELEYRPRLRYTGGNSNPDTGEVHIKNVGNKPFYVQLIATEINLSGDEFTPLEPSSYRLILPKEGAAVNENDFLKIGIRGKPQIGFHPTLSEYRVDIIMIDFRKKYQYKSTFFHGRHKHDLSEVENITE